MCVGVIKGSPEVDKTVTNISEICVWLIHSSFNQILINLKGGGIYI